MRKCFESFRMFPKETHRISLSCLMALVVHVDQRVCKRTERRVQVITKALLPANHLLHAIISKVIEKKIMIRFQNKPIEIVSSIEEITLTFWKSEFIDGSIPTPSIPCYWLSIKQQNMFNIKFLNYISITTFYRKNTNIKVPIVVVITFCS